MLVTRRWERQFRAMGTDCHVIVTGPAGLTGRAVDRVAELQSAWTRFDPGSEVSRLNAAGRGRVSPDTWRLVTTGLVARRITGGRFDPFMVDQIVAAGYDRDFPELADRVAAAPSGAPAVRRPVRGLDRRTRTVRLAPGAGLDSGGLGKGLAADLVAADLMAAGADSCLVNLGGDLRVRGTETWTIGIEAEGPGGPPVSVRLAAGGLATSSTSRRVWRTAGGSGHHVLDPRTGRPLRVRVAGATAIAPAGWLAEAFSKTLLLVGPKRGTRLLGRHRAGGLLQHADGTVVPL